MLKRYLFIGLWIAILGVNGAVFAADTEVILDSNTASSGFAVKDASNNTIMRAGGDGNVGIGTSIPNFPLHVNATTGGHTAKIENNLQNGRALELRIAGTDAATALTMWTTNAAGTISGTSIDFDGTISPGFRHNAARISGFITDMSVANNGALTFETKSGGTVAERMRIHSNGNVGIGTTAPQTQFHVEASSPSSPPPAQRGIRASLGAVNVNLVADVNEGFVGTRSNHPFRIASNNFVRMVFDTGGKVGIGTTKPQGKLNVNGAIFQRGGSLHADYVFKSDYKLESIDEHSKFMWQEKHLKAIPKAGADENGMETVEVGSHRKGIVEELGKRRIST